MLYNNFLKCNWSPPTSSSANMFEISFSKLINWGPPSLSELTPLIFDMVLTHLGSEAT